MPAKKKRDFGEHAQVAADTDTKKLDHPDDIKKRKPAAAPKKRGRKRTVDYDRDDQFDHRSAEGFISLYGLPVRTQAQLQREEELEDKG